MSILHSLLLKIMKIFLGLITFFAFFGIFFWPVIYNLGVSSKIGRFFQFCVLFRIIRELETPWAKYLLRVVLRFELDVKSNWACLSENWEKWFWCAVICTFLQHLASVSVALNSNQAWSRLLKSLLDNFFSFYSISFFLWYIFLNFDTKVCFCWYWHQISNKCIGEINT